MNTKLSQIKINNQLIKMHNDQIRNNILLLAHAKSLGIEINREQLIADTLNQKKWIATIRKDNRKIRAS